MQITQLPKIPAQSVYYLLLCTTGILLFIGIGIYPLHSSITQQDEDLARMRVRLEEQKVLLPVYKDLLLLGKVQKKDLGALPASSRAGLSVDQLGNISALFKKIAQACSLEVVSAAPDVKALTSNSKFMPVVLVIRGDFFNLRRFLFELERLPFMEHMEEMQIQETAGGKEFRIKTWLAINSEKST
jgi:hypothetical protein